MIEQAKRISQFGSAVLEGFSALCIACLVGTVAIATVSRYALAKPLVFGIELPCLLLAAIFFLALANVFTKGGHIKASLLLSRLPPKARGYMEILNKLVALLFIIVFIKESYLFTYESYKLGCYTADAHIYEVPWMGVMVLSMVMLAVVVLVSCIDDARKYLHRKNKMAGTN